MNLARLVRHFTRGAPPTDPDFAPLFQPDTTGEVVALDTETTSLDPKRAELVSIGAVIIQGNRLLTSTALHLLVRPTRAMDEASIKTHGLRPCDLEQALAAEQAIRQLLRFIGPRPLLGYYLEFDLAVLNRYLTRLFDFSLPNRWIEVSSLYHDRKIGLLPNKPVDLRFETIRQALDIPLLGRHNALNDAIMAAMMYLKLRS